MKKLRSFLTVLIFTMSGWVLPAGAQEWQIVPLAPGSPDGVKEYGMRENRPFPISTAIDGQNIPDVTCGSNDQFLVVWNDFSNAEEDQNGRIYFDISGALVSSEYGVVSDPFCISNQYRPLGAYNRAATAYNEDYDEFLVCWMDQDHVFGQRLSSEGYLIGENFVIDACSSGFITVTYNSLDVNYLVTYPVRGEGLTGAVLGPEGESTGASFVISREGSAQQAVFNSDTNEFMVVYAVEVSSVRMRAVSASGKLAQEIVVSDAMFMQYCPTVAYNAYLREYLVVWYDERHWEAYCSEFYARSFDWDGQATSEEYLLIGGEVNLLHAPHLAYDPNACGYVLAWARQYDYVNFEFEILVQRLDCTGQITGDVMNLRKGGIRHQNGARVVFNPDSERYLTVFEQSMGLFDDGADICGQFLGTISSLPLGNGQR